MSNYNKKITDTNIRIGEVRFSFVNVFAPRANKDGTPGKYDCCILIPKTDKVAIKMIEDAIAAAELAGKEKGIKLPAKHKTPLRDGDEEHPDDDSFAEMMFMNAGSKNKPGVRVLENGQVAEALDAEDFYSGCYGAASVNFYAYNQDVNKGIGCGLNNVIKTRDGEKLSGGRSADEDFDDLGDNSLN